MFEVEKTESQTEPVEEKCATGIEVYKKPFPSRWGLDLGQDNPRWLALKQQKVL